MGSGDRSKLVKICDQAGRPRGTGFVADDRGTVVTSHQAVARSVPLTLHSADGLSCPVGPDDITELPALGLALLRTGGPGTLGVEPLPIAVREQIGTGTYVRIAAHGWREARVLGTIPATYSEGGRDHPVTDALELALGTDGRDALRSGGAAVGGPVTDPRTGAVLGVLSTALSAGRETAGLAVPLAPQDAPAPLAEVLRRNANSVPGYGRDLNLAGALQLTATSLGHADSRPCGTEAVERPDISAEFTAFETGTGPVLGMVGAPGTGRTTELAALADRRARGPVPALTLWLRGADLLADDTSVTDAMTRALQRSGRILTAAGARGDMEAATPERVARLAAASGNPLLVVVDGPEEMPPLLAHRLAGWAVATAEWLQAHEVRMVVACRPEHWETAGALYPREHCTARSGLPEACRPQSGSATSRRNRPSGRRSGTASRPARSLPATTGIRSRCACSPRCGPHCRPTCPAGRARRRSSPPIWISPASGSPSGSGSRPSPGSGAPRSADWRRGWPARSTRRPDAASGRARASWTGRRSRRSSPGARAGPRPYSPRACWSRRARDTASPTRSWATGCRARTSTWTRRCTRWSTAGMRTGPPQNPRPPRWTRRNPTTSRCRATASAPCSRRCSCWSGGRGPRPWPTAWLT